MTLKAMVNSSITFSCLYVYLSVLSQCQMANCKSLLCHFFSYVLCLFIQLLSVLILYGTEKLSLRRYFLPLGVFHTKCNIKSIWNLIIFSAIKICVMLVLSYYIRQALVNLYFCHIQDICRNFILKWKS